MHHERLRPLYQRLGVKRHTYAEIVWHWFVLNRPPHTDWEQKVAPTGPDAPPKPRASHKNNTPETIQIDHREDASHPPEPPAAPPE